MSAPFSSTFVPAIKTATKTALTHVGGVDAAARISRVGRTQFSDYQNRSKECVVPVDVAVDLDHCAEHPFILEAMAHALGYVLMPLRVGTSDFGKDMSQFGMASVDVMATAMKVLEDNQLDPEEADEIIPKMLHAQRILEQAIAFGRAVQKSAKPHIVRPMGDAAHG
ncbi:hypothetical protein [Acetobacter ascendens]|uniref:hypothetical protein n=1 Tax=Acetobacter ascendens TaxID=481146 RepID=UPI000875C628|nr:hypothetical protein [Acetobacter ascendens]AOW49407.1 hypothetical protein A4R89_08245 [Acetobacter ascendens]